MCSYHRVVDHIVLPTSSNSGRYVNIDIMVDELFVCEAFFSVHQLGEPECLLKPQSGRCLCHVGEIGIGSYCLGRIL